MNKYLLTTLVAKRAKDLEFNNVKPLVKYKRGDSFITIALKEIKAGKVFLKEKEEPLKAKDIFSETE